MRIALFVLCALAIPAHAQQPELVDGPPSPTLERAIKLYDRRDFYSASVELQKVLEGQTQDGRKSKQRAEFFMAKTLYNLGYYAAAGQRMDTIATQGGVHVYFTATAKWLVALYRVAPSAPFGHTLLAYRGTNVLDDPTLASVRDEFAYYLGRELARGDIPKQEAVAVLAQVSPESPFAAKARVEIERMRVRSADQAAFEAKLRAETSPPFARYHAARKSPPDVPVDIFDAVMIPTACHEAGDLAPTARKVIEEALALVAKLRDMDDNAELAMFVLRLRRSPPQPGGDVVLAAMAESEIAEAIGWDVEVDAELKSLRRADKAWQTTQVAAEVLQELTILQSLGQADLGKLVRDRLDRLAHHLAALSAALQPNMRLDVPRELCSGPAAPTIAEQPATVRPQSGCAGCATRDARWSGVVLLAIVLLRRRARRR